MGCTPSAEHGAGPPGDERFYNNSRSLLSGIPPVSLSAVLVFFFRVLTVQGAGLQVTQHQEQSGCSLGSSIPSESPERPQPSQAVPHKARFLSLLPGGPWLVPKPRLRVPHPVPNEDPGTDTERLAALVHCCQRRVGLLLSIF